MIPIRDHNPTKSVPLVTTLLILINILVFLLEVSIPENNFQSFIFSYGAIPRKITAIREISGYGYTIFTSMFIHGNLLHIAGNMLYLWIFGNNVEDVLGKFRFLIFYLLSGIAAAYTHAISAPESNIPMIGASGAISGVLGAYLLLFPFARVDTLVIFFLFIRVIPLPAVMFLVLWFVYQFIGANFSGGGIAWFAHIGGFIAGIILIKLMPKKKRASIRF